MSYTTDYEDARVLVASSGGFMLRRVLLMIRCPKTGKAVATGIYIERALLAALSEPDLPPREGAELFHGTLAAGLADWIVSYAAAHGHYRVALSGGCMMNRVLTESLCARLRARDLAPLLARAVPPNDGGLSLGQAFVARHQISIVGKDA